MPMFDTIMLLVAALGFAAAACLFSPRARARLGKGSGWAVLAAAALSLSGASWFLAEEHMGGTLLHRRHGWPKVFSMQCLSPECVSQGPTFDALYFLGNSFAYAAPLVLAWTLLALIRRNS